MKSIFKPALLAGLFLVSTSANALLLEISDTADFTGTVVAAADDDNDGMVMINSGLGNWIVNVATGIAKPLIGNDDLARLDLNSINVTGAAGTIYLRLTDIDFLASGPGYSAEFGGTTDGTASLQSYVDAANAEFGQGMLLSDSGVLGSGAFSGSDRGGINMLDPYSISIFAAISHTGAGQVSSFDYLVSVPEPGTLALLGLGLLGIAVLRQRRLLVARV